MRLNYSSNKVFF